MGVVILTTLIAYFNFISYCYQWSMTDFGNNPSYKFGIAADGLPNLPWQQFDNTNSYLCNQP